MTSDPPILCLRAPNPSPLTGTGTNTYLIGATEVALVDPGPDLPEHLDAITAALGPGQRITHIIVTHAHLDHSALAPRIAAATGAPVYAFGTALEGRSPLMAGLALMLPDHGEGLDLTFTPDQRLGDDDRLNGPDWTLTALHTPGHLGGHICLAMGETLFSGDHVMGWSTSIISPPDGDMAAYMASLDRLAQRHWRKFLAGHGAPIEDPDARVQELIAHRRQREQEILHALAGGPARIPQLAIGIYHQTPTHLLPAARRNVLAHLIDLSSRNQVVASPALHPDAEFYLT